MTASSFSVLLNVDTFHGKRSICFLILFCVIVLPCSSDVPIPDQPPHTKSKWWYTNPQHPRTKYFNEILPAMFAAARPHMGESAFEVYLFKERGKRWELKLKCEKLEKRLNYFLSEDNSACCGQYLIPLNNVKPTDIDHCQRGVKEISMIEESILKEKSEIQRNYEMLFDKKGQHCKPWAKEQRQYYETLLENLKILLDTTEDGKSKLSLNLSRCKKAFSTIACTKKSSQVKRRRKENKRKARKRKRQREESSAQNLMEQLVGDYTFRELCFPDGYCKDIGSQHAITEDELSLEVLQDLKTKSSVKVLELLSNQGCFALDAFCVIGQTIDRLEVQ